MKINGSFIVFTLILVVLQTACKYLFAADLDMSGFSPFIAIALFSGFIIKDRKASFLLPLLALFISDAIIHVLYLNGQFDFAGFYTGQWKNYLFLLSATVLGWILKGRTYGTVAAGAIIAPSVYFLISNFSVWMGTSEAVYAKTFSGLMTCYTAGLPFYKNELISTVLFLPAILFLYNYMTRHKAQLTLA
jgi:hypothetical protein